MLLETKYLNRRYRQTPEPPTSNYFNQTPQQITIPLSTTNGSKSRVIKTGKFTQPIENNLKNFSHNKLKNQESQLQKLDKVQIFDYSEKFDKLELSEQKTKWSYHQWLQRNSLRIGLSKKYFKQKADISLNNKKVAEEQGFNGLPTTYQKNNDKFNRNMKNQGSKFSINKIYTNNYNSLLGSLNNQDKNKMNVKVLQYTEKRVVFNSTHQKNQRMNTSQILQQPCNKSQNLKQKQQNQDIKSLNKKITIQLKREPTYFSSLQRNRPINQEFGKIHQNQQKNAYYPTITPHKLSVNLQNQIYHVQSFKGKRPYNEDRYICQLKNGKFHSNKLMRITNRFDRNPKLNQIQQGQNKINGHNNWLFGVFDGHGGAKCAEFLKQNIYEALITNRSLFNDPKEALKQTFLKLQQKFLLLCQKCGSLQSSGSCAVACFLRNKKLYIGNVGDCRALLLNTQTYKQITKDHKPDEKDQKTRIIRYGGKLYKDGSVMGIEGKQNIKIFNQTRIIPGSLNVSRTIGDIQVKVKKYGGLPGIVIPDPDIFVQQLRGEFQYLLLASDGLFEGLQNKQIHQSYVKLSKSYQNDKYNTQSFVKTFTKQLIRKSAQKSNDNITIICLKLPIFQADAL